MVNSSTFCRRKRGKEVSQLPKTQLLKRAPACRKKKDNEYIGSVHLPVACFQKLMFFLHSLRPGGPWARHDCV